ncbi:OmpP1/FadL family transporter [candidate division KSB1 bacterium]
MRFGRLSILVLFMTLAVFSFSVYASGLRLTAQGAKALGFGGAFVAGADDPTAIFYNPAGISNLSGTNIIFGGGVFYNSGFTEIKPSALSGKVLNMDSELFMTPTIFATTNLTPRITVGLGIYSPFGIESVWEDRWSGRESWDYPYETNLRTYSFNPALSYRVNSRLNLGFGIEYVRGSYDLKRYNTSLFESTLSETSGAGISFNGGAQFFANETTILGLSLRGPLKLDLDGTMKIGTNITQDVTSELNLPLSVTFGYNYFPRDEMRVEIDATWTRWSGMDKFDMIAQNPIYSTSDEKKLEDKISISAGVEFRADYLYFRTGIAHVPSPLEEEFFDPTLPLNTYDAASVGIGLERGDVTIDIGYFHIFKNERKSFIRDGEYISDSRMERQGDIFVLNFGYRIF